MKRIFGILLFALFCFMSWFCQKRLIGKIQLKGKVIDWFTGNLVPIKVSVGAYTKADFFHLKEGSVDLGSFESSGDFDKKVKSAKSDRYLINFTEATKHLLMEFPSSFWKTVTIKNKSTEDFGVLEMPHVFVWKVALTYTSTSTNHIVFLDVNGNHFGINYPPGVNSTIYLGQAFSREEVQTNGNSLTLSYTLRDTSFPYEVFGSVSAPLGSSDTVAVNISY